MKLIGNENYLSLANYVKLWFISQGYEDHLTKQEAMYSRDRSYLMVEDRCSMTKEMEIKNVFFHGDLAEEVYMEQPPGFVTHGESNLVCRPMSFLTWFETVSSSLIWPV